MRACTVAPEDGAKAPKGNTCVSACDAVPSNSPEATPTLRSGQSCSTRDWMAEVAVGCGVGVLVGADVDVGRDVGAEVEVAPGVGVCVGVEVSSGVGDDVTVSPTVILPSSMLTSMDSPAPSSK